MIFKFQQGGSAIPPYAVYQPVVTPEATRTSSAAASKQASAKKGNDLTDKDLLELLTKLDGLPSDMAVLTNTLQNFYIDQQNGTIDSTNIASRYIKTIQQLKVANFNKKEYEAAYDKVSSNGGINEVAINERGYLYCTNGKDFKLLTVDQLKDSEGEYKALTNSELLQYRAHYPEFANKNQMLAIVKNGIGIETVNKYIHDSINNLGSASDSQEGYSMTKAGDLIKGLQDFQQAVQRSGGKFDGTINDLYKYKYLTKTQAEQAKKAIQYIYQTMPVNAKTLLKVKSDGSDNGALKLIETLVSSKIDTQSQFDLDLEGGPTADKAGKNKTGKDDTDLKTSLPLNVQKGIGGVDSFVDVDRGDGIHMSVRGTQYNLINTPNGESIMDTSLATMLNESGLQGIVKDLRNIQFGDQKLSPEALSQITYNNTGVTRANLPIKSDGSVNLELLEAYEQAEKELDVLRDKSPDKVKEVYDKYGISELLNSDGSYNQRKFAPFMVTEGYTTDALSGLKDSDFVKEYRGNEDAAVALIQRSLAIGKGKDVQMPDVDTFGWYNPADWFGWTDTIYKGVIYIPIDNNVNAAVYGANQSLDYNEAMQQEEKYQNFEKNSNQRSTDSSVLNI